MKIETKEYEIKSYRVPNISIPKMREYLKLVPKNEIEQLTKIFKRNHANSGEDELTKFLASCFNTEMHEMRTNEVKEYKRALNEMPSYMVLDKTIDIIADYVFEKRLYTSYEEKDGVIEQMWNRLEETLKDLETIYIIDKSKVIGPIESTDKWK